MTASLDALCARIAALERMQDEREERTKERFIAIKSAVDAALASADRAIAKADMATEKRFDGVNEFRATLQDQAARLMPRAEYTVQHQALVEIISRLEDSYTASQSKMIGRGEGLGWIGSIILGAATIISVLIAIFSLLSNIVK